MRYLAFVGVLLGTVTVLSSPAAAGNGALRTNQDVSGTFYVTTQYQSPNQSWTFQTSNLVPSTADTVIHVQSFDDPHFGYIGGDDDSGGNNASRAWIPGISTGRTLLVIVRAYSAASGGTCTLTATPSSGSPWSVSVPFGGSTYSMGSLAASSHVSTAQPPGGGNDTVMLVVQGNSQSWHAVSYDDDSGVGNMSFIRTPETCSDCYVVVANYSGSAVQKTNIIWDEDAETHDSDGDGLGDGLEQSLGTNWTAGAANKDTDQDGIPDNYELYGLEPVNDPYNPVRFPFMGADAKLKDIFVQADWLQCTGQNCGFLGVDAYQMQPSDVADYAAGLAPVRIHMDTGMVNPDPASTTYNAWGFAQRIASPVPCATALYPTLVHLFHHQNVLDTGGGGSPGYCYDSERNVRTGLHEFGHGMFLEHGGRPLVIDLNEKPQHQSIMNYGYQGDPTNAPSYSHGTGASLNLSALVECPSVPYSATWLNKLESGEWLYKVDHVHGCVDWNRDGAFAPTGTTVRAAVTCTPVRFYDNDCVSNGASDIRPSGVLSGPTMAWQKAVGGSIGSRLLLFGVDSTKHVVYKSALKTNLDTACGSFTTFDQDNAKYNNCAGLNLSSNSPGPAAGTTNFGPAAVALGNNNVMVIVADSNNKPASYTLTTSGTGVDTWSGPTALPGNIAVNGDLAAVSVATGIATVWAPSGGRLKLWTFVSGAWGPR